MDFLKLPLIIVLIVFLYFNVSAQTSPGVKKSIYYLIDTFTTKNKKLYAIQNSPQHYMFGSHIKFNYPCYYSGEYSPYFLQLKKTIKTISKNEMKQLSLISTKDFLELVCKNGSGSGGLLVTYYDIYFVEKLKKSKYLLYKVFSSPPPRIE